MPWPLSRNWRGSMTSPSLTRLRFRPCWYRAWRASTSLSVFRETEGMSCLGDTTVMYGALTSGASWRPFRSGCGHLGGLTLNALSPRSWQRVLNFLEPALPAHLKQRHSGDKLQKLADALSASSPEHLYLKLVSHWDNPIGARVGCFRAVDGRSQIPDSGLTPRKWRNA